MQTFNILTMGCKVNTYDTSLLEQKLVRAGFVPSSERPSIQIINSCAVTEKSSLETRRWARKIKAVHPEAVVVITGCVAQVDLENLKRLSGADLIIGNSHKENLENIIGDFMAGRSGEKVFHSNIFRKTQLDEGGGIERSRTRAFLKIQDGCNSFCSFCIIPFARGKSRSIPKDNLISRIREMTGRGFQEVVLTGVHCGDYRDGSLDFAGLVEAVIKETSIARVRLSSLEPIEVTQSLWELFKGERRLCPHIHVSLQSANSEVLKRMKRKYGQLEIINFFNEFQKNIPHGFIGMDVIVGFPGETEGEFADTFELLASIPCWTRIHVFPYSVRPGTAAARLPDHVHDRTIHDRARKLRELSLDRQREMAQKQVGALKQALVLEKPSYGAQGITRDYWHVKISDLKPLACVNEELRVEITGSEVWKNSESILLARMAQM